MRITFVAVLIPLALAAALPGCAYDTAQVQEANACRVIGQKALLGGLAGAAGGAALGAAADGGRYAAIGAGVGLLAGAIAGHVADKQDCAAAQVALRQQLFAARADEAIAWSSQSGHRGEYRAVGVSYTAAGGAVCRKAQSVGGPGSTEIAAPVLVCRQANGDYTYANA